MSPVGAGICLCVTVDRRVGDLLGEDIRVDTAHIRGHPDGHLHSRVGQVDVDQAVLADRATGTVVRILSDGYAIGRARTVKKEAARKHERDDAINARKVAQRLLEHVSTRARIEIAGEFGDKRFLVRLEELIADRPYDVVNLHLEVPTVKGARQKPPSYMTFEVTSEQQDDITPFVTDIKTLVHDAGLVLVADTKL